MSETTQEERDEVRKRRGRTPDHVIHRLCNDADRLAAIERGLCDVIEELNAASMAEYRRGDAVRQAEYKALSNKLSGILDSPEEP